jgi:hypothetical protein
MIGRNKKMEAQKYSINKEGALIMNDVPVGCPYRPTLSSCGIYCALFSFEPKGYDATDNAAGVVLNCGSSRIIRKVTVE